MDERELMGLIQSSPDEGIREAINRYGKDVNAICRKILGTSMQDLLDEAVSDTFYKVWKYSSRFDSRRGTSLKSWICAIARNSAIDLLRKQPGNLIYMDDLEMELKTEEAGPQEALDARETGMVLWNSIRSLGEPDHSVFLCRYYLNMSGREIAETLGLNQKKVANILNRRKKQLRKMLEERGLKKHENL